MARTVFLLTFLLAAGCSEAVNPWSDAKPGQLKVLTSFPPLYCFTANVAGEHAAVKCVLTSTGPHDYSATHVDSLKVARADLFVVNGLELDDFALELITLSGNRKRGLIFKVGEALEHDVLIHLDEHERASISTTTAASASTANMIRTCGSGPLKPSPW